MGSKLIRGRPAEEPWDRSIDAGSLPNTPIPITSPFHYLFFQVMFRKRKVPFSEAFFGVEATRRRRSGRCRQGWTRVRINDEGSADGFTPKSLRRTVRYQWMNGIFPTAGVRYLGFYIVLGSSNHARVMANQGGRGRGGRAPGSGLCVIQRGGKRPDGWSPAASRSHSEPLAFNYM